MPSATTTLKHLLAIVLGLSLIDDCCFQKQKSITDPCAKVHGHAFRCVNARNCNRQALSPKPKQCGPDGIGVCCKIISSLSPQSCGIRYPGMLEEDFNVPSHFRQENESSEDAKISETTQSSSDDIEEPSATLESLPQMSEASPTTCMKMDPDDASNIENTITEDMSQMTLKEEEVDSSEPLAEMTDTTQVPTDDALTTAEMTVDTDMTVGIDMTVDTDMTSDTEMMVDTEMTVSDDSKQRKIRDAIQLSFLPRPLNEKHYESLRENEKEAKDSISFKSFDNGNHDIFVDGELVGKPSNDSKSKKEIYFQKPQVRIRDIDYEYPTMIPQQEYVKNIGLIDQPSRFKRENSDVKPASVILQAFERFLLGSTTVASNYANQNIMKDPELEFVVLNTSKSTNEELVAISEVLTDYVITGNIPNDTAQVLLDTILNLIISHKGYERACQIHPDMANVLKAQRNITCPHSSTQFIGRPLRNARSSTLPDTNTNKHTNTFIPKSEFQRRKQLENKGKIVDLQKNIENETTYKKHHNLIRRKRTIANSKPTEATAVGMEPEFYTLSSKIPITAGQPEHFMQDTLFRNLPNYRKRNPMKAYNEHLKDGIFQNQVFNKQLDKNNNMHTFEGKTKIFSYEPFKKLFTDKFSQLSTQKSQSLHTIGQFEYYQKKSTTVRQTQRMEIDKPRSSTKFKNAYPLDTILANRSQEDLKIIGSAETPIVNKSLLHRSANLKSSSENNNRLEYGVEALYKTGLLRKGFKSAIKDNYLQIETEQNVTHGKESIDADISIESEAKSISNDTENIINRRGQQQDFILRKEDESDIGTFKSEETDLVIGRTTKSAQMEQDQNRNAVENKIQFPQFKQDASEKLPTTDASNSSISLTNTEAEQTTNRLIKNAENYSEVTTGKTETQIEKNQLFKSEEGNKDTSDIKSRRKREYGSMCSDEDPDATVQAESTPAVTEDSLDEEDSEESEIMSRSYNKQFIVGGRTEEQPWPWIVAIYLEPTRRFVCAGTLFDDRHILSAAHCFQSKKINKDPTRLVVTIGHLKRTDMDTKESNEKVQYYKVKLLFNHEGFRSDCFCNDIAILRLASPVAPNHIPACIPETDPARVGQTVTTMGWGDTTYGSAAIKGVRGSYTLQRIDDLLIYDGKECRKILSSISGVPMPKNFGAYYICAGVPSGEKDACVGDSGGPLMFEDYDGYWSLVGLVSFGYKCATPGVPGTYSRISYFLPWIINVTNSM